MCIRDSNTSGVGGSSTTLTSAGHGFKTGDKITYTAGGTQLTGTLDADSLVGSTSSLAVGKGNSTDEVLDTALGGATHIARTAEAGDFAAAGEIHGRVKASTGAFTDGTVSFIVEFIHLGGN